VRSNSEEKIPVEITVPRTRAKTLALDMKKPKKMTVEGSEKKDDDSLSDMEETSESYVNSARTKILKNRKSESTLKSPKKSSDKHEKSPKDSDSSMSDKIGKDKFSPRPKKKLQKPSGERPRGLSETQQRKVVTSPGRRRSSSAADTPKPRKKGAEKNTKRPFKPTLTSASQPQNSKMKDAKLSHIDEKVKHSKKNELPSSSSAEEKKQKMSKSMEEVAK